MKQLKFEKPKKVDKRKLKKKADVLFSLYVRRLGRCELQGRDGVKCGGYLQCAHIETRGVLAVRWDKMNALCLCGGHHWFYTNSETKWQAIIKKEFPKKYAFYLKHKNDIWDGDYDKVLKRLEAL